MSGLVISGALALGASNQALPLSHPRIGWENLLRNSDCVITASGEQEGFEVSSLANALTWDFWKADVLPAVALFTFPEAQEVNYCGIAAHTLTSANCSIELQYYNGTSWVSVSTVQPQSSNGNRSIMFLFDTVFAAQWRIIAQGTSVPAIGVVYLGKVMEVERRIYQGHTPITLGKKTVIRPQKSEGGQWLGRSIVREGAQTTIAIKNLTAAWVRATFQPFMESARSYPFFFAWRPDEFPQEVGYCWTAEDIRPTNSGPRDLMSVSFPVDALIE